jgi:hypothetical protein
MARAHRTDLIPALADAVFNAITEPERIILWHPHFRAVRPLSSGPITVGTRLEVTSARMGVFALEVLVYERGRRYSAGGTVRGIHMVHEYELAAVAGGTQLTQSATGTATGVSLFGLLLPLLVRKSVATNAARLRRHFAVTQPVPA